jgi:CheY-like chemotaxis protein
MAELPRVLKALDVPILFSESQGLNRPTPLISPPAAGREPARTQDSPKAQGPERKQYLALNAWSPGVKRMGLVESKRPVVLIVEDEFLLRMDAVDMIAAAGFEVVEAANADQAIDILEARKDITVIFTDIQMPGSMDGLKLARAVRGRWPPIKIVATSGHLNVTESDLPEGGRFLAKPYSPGQVMRLLRELTGRL